MSDSLPRGRTFVSVGVVLAVAVVLGGLWWIFMRPAQTAHSQGAPAGGFAIPVEAVPVKVGPSRREVAAVGSLRSNESVTLRPEVATRVVAIGFEEGQKVQKGQTLIQLDNSVQRAELAQAEAALVLSRANFERADELVKRGAGTQRALDEARAKLRTDEASVALTKARLEKYTLSAPFNSVAGLRRISIGDFVNVGAEIVNLEMIDPLKVDFRVPELFLPAVRTGQTITVTADAFPDRSFAGTVYAIDPLIDAAGRSLVIRARIDNPDDSLRPGLFLRVTLQLSVKENALFVREESLIPMGDATFVYRLAEPPSGAAVPQGAKIAQMTRVSIGERRRGEIEIMDGLQPTDTVVTAGILKLRDGTPVQVIPAAPVPQASAGGSK